jgi:3-oxoacyl-[acyl-carrier-protein] synthase-3
VPHDYGAAVASARRIRRPFDIAAIEVVLGDRALPVAEMGEDFAKVIPKTGISTVHQSSRDATELAVDAAVQVMKKTNWPTDRIKTVIVVTQSPRYVLPGISSTIHDGLQLGTDCLTFDINQGCAGFVQGLVVANNFVDTFSDVLLICTDTYRQKLSKWDRSTQAVFSDGASAAIISSEPVLAIVGESHYSDGAGLRFLFQSREATDNGGYLHMAGAEVFLFAKKVVARQIRSTVKAADLTPEEIDVVYPHQASRIVLDEITNSLHDFPKVINEVHLAGNLVSSSIPLLLSSHNLSFRTKTSVLCGFGVGLACSTLVLQARD